MEEKLIKAPEHMKPKLKAKKLKNFLDEEYKFITNLLTTCNVPNRIEKDDSDLYLLPLENANSKPLTISDFQKSNKHNKQDLDDRLLKIKNKLKAPKKNKSEKALKRKEMKKSKRNKQIKKILNFSQNAENERTKIKQFGLNEVDEDHKDIKPIKMVKNNLNEENNILFSKIDFAPHPGARVKRSKNQKVMKNPKDILQKIKETDRKLHELRKMGEEDKALNLKKELIWRKAFDKVQGKKVKDDRQLLFKSIKKKKVLKKKSKLIWKQRQEKVQKDIESRQKKREDNIAKRKKNVNISKLKKLSKKGRVIPGF